MSSRQTELTEEHNRLCSNFAACFFPVLWVMWLIFSPLTAHLKADEAKTRHLPQSCIHSACCYSGENTVLVQMIFFLVVQYPFIYNTRWHQVFHCRQCWWADLSSSLLQRGVKFCGHSQAKSVIQTLFETAAFFLWVCVCMWWQKLLLAFFSICSVSSSSFWFCSWHLIATDWCLSLSTSCSDYNWWQHLAFFFGTG